MHRSCTVARPPQYPVRSCLRLNLGTPDLNASHRRLVMVYMHVLEDSPVAAAMIFSPTAARVLTAIDGVVLTHIHRLNVHGYLSLDSLEEKNMPSSANVGMLDLVAVLKTLFHQESGT